MTYKFKVIDISHKNQIMDMENWLLDQTNISQEEKMFTSWKAPWREESLQFYLQTGWCMGAFQPEGFNTPEEKLMGYFLAQPLMFVESLTQSLWVEHISVVEDHLNAELVEIAYKYARDKHLQRVLFLNPKDLGALKDKAIKLENDTFQILTAKLK